MTEDKPVVDDLDAAYAEIRRKPYVFTWEGRDWTMCHFAELDFETQEQIESSDSMDLAKLRDLFRQAMGETQFAEWSTVQRPIPFLEMLFQRWMTFSGTKPGEDSASGSSSGSIGKSSRQTSGASTTSASLKRSTAKKAAPAKRVPRQKREPSAAAMAASLRENSST